LHAIHAVVAGRETWRFQSQTKERRAIEEQGMIGKGQTVRGRLSATCIELAGVNSRKLMKRITRTEKASRIWR
jgi:hypothetical protein